MQNKYTDNEELVQSLFLVCPYCDFDEEEALEPPTYSSWKSLMLHFEKCRSCGEQWANDPYFDLVEATTQVCPFGFGKGGILTTSKDGYCKTPDTNGMRCIGCRIRYGYTSRGQKKHAERHNTWQKDVKLACKETGLPWFSHDRKVLQDDGSYDWALNSKVRKQMAENAAHREAAAAEQWDSEEEHSDLGAHPDTPLWARCEICEKWRIVMGSDLKKLHQEKGVFRCKFLEGCTCNTKDDSINKYTASQARRAKCHKSADALGDSDSKRKVKPKAAREEYEARYSDSITAGYISKSDIVFNPDNHERLDQARKVRLTLLRRIELMAELCSRIRNHREDITKRLQSRVNGSASDSDGMDVDMRLSAGGDAQRKEFLRSKKEACDRDLQIVDKITDSNKRVLYDLEGAIKTCCNLLEVDVDFLIEWSTTNSLVQSPRAIWDLVERYSPNNGGYQNMIVRNSVVAAADDADAPHPHMQGENASIPFIPP